MKAAYRENRSFRDCLRKELAVRCARNSQYSLRAFANYLGVNHSTLSQMMRGRRSISAAAIEKFGYRLGLTQAEVAEWVESEKHQVRTATAEPLLELTRDMAEVLGDWTNFAILELTRLDDFQADSRWIARMLGIGVDEVNLAVSRLCRLGLLKMESPSVWRDQLGNAVLNMNTFEEAAIDGFLRRLSDVSSATVAVPKSLVPEAIARIAGFRSQFLAWLEEAQTRDEVYQLQITFIPVTRRENGQARNAMADPLEES